MRQADQNREDCATCDGQRNRGKLQRPAVCGTTARPPPAEIRSKQSSAAPHQGKAAANLLTVQPEAATQESWLPLQQTVAEQEVCRQRQDKVSDAHAADQHS